MPEVQRSERLLRLPSVFDDESITLNVRTHFAYHLTHHFGPFSLKTYHTNSEKPREGDHVFVVSGDDGDDGRKEFWLEGLFRIHRRIEGPFDLVNLAGEPARFQYKLPMTAIRAPDAPIPLRNAVWYDRTEARNNFASGQNFNPLPKGYRERFEELLAGYGQSEAEQIAEDLEEVRSRVVDATERQALVQARIGQGRFRSDVTRLWGKGEVCALTGIALPEMLIASHIKPWRDSDDAQRLDPANGLLLAVHADKLFDRYLLSFNLVRGELQCVIAPTARLAARSAGLAEGKALNTAHLSLTMGRRLETYMEGHHRRFLARKAAMAATNRLSSMPS